MLYVVTFQTVVVTFILTLQAGDAVMVRLYCMMVTSLLKAALQQQSQPGTVHAALGGHVRHCTIVH